MFAQYSDHWDWLCKNVPTLTAHHRGLKVNDCTPKTTHLCISCNSSEQVEAEWLRVCQCVYSKCVWIGSTLVTFKQLKIIWLILLLISPTILFQMRKTKFEKELPDVGKKNIMRREKEREADTVT